MTDGVLWGRCDCQGREARGEIGRVAVPYLKSIGFP
jgi:hypothetical protein